MPSKLYIGTIDANGHVDPRPVIVDAQGWRHLSGHEPPSTTFSPTLFPIP